MPRPADPADLIVLGAGPAGVGAAYRTARAGHRVVVLERAPLQLVAEQAPEVAEDAGLDRRV